MALMPVVAEMRIACDARVRALASPLFLSVTSRRVSVTRHRLARVPQARRGEPPSRWGEAARPPSPFRAARTRPARLRLEPAPARPDGG